MQIFQTGERCSGAVALALLCIVVLGFPAANATGIPYRPRDYLEIDHAQRQARTSELIESIGGWVKVAHIKSQLSNSDAWADTWSEARVGWEIQGGWKNDLEQTSWLAGLKNLPNLEERARLRAYLSSNEARERLESYLAYRRQWMRPELAASAEGFGTDGQFAAVPVPAPLLLFGSGLIGLILAAVRRVAGL